MLKKIGIAAALAAVTLASLSTVRAQDTRRVRLGTYDNRAIAVAFAPSRFSPMAEKMEEMRAAKAAGDTARIQALEEWGQRLQRDLHRQGFGRAPVDDLLAHVAERLPEVALQEGVDAIVWLCDHAGPDVELVDVTDALVALFEPDAKTLERAKQIREHEPLDLDEIERDHDH